MGSLAGNLPGAALCCALATAGDWLAVRLGLPVPGAVIGLAVYLLWLLAGQHVASSSIAWSRPGAALLLRWLGALIVPALVGLSAYAAILAGALLPLVLLLILTTVATALVTAGLYRLLGGAR